jgi:peptidoglycan/xylan/chitin deacetylase (PgdA/CDA1 family)
MHDRLPRRRGYPSAITILVLGTVAAAMVRQGVFQSSAHAGDRAATQVATVDRADDPSLEKLQAGLVKDPSTVRAAESEALGRFAALGLPIYCGGGSKPYVALTFDDGPGPYTEQTLSLLRTAGAKATFFSVGKKLEYFPDAPRMELAAGAVGNHTWNHVDLRGATAQRLADEVGATRDALAEATSGAVHLFRPPYGAHDASLDQYLRYHDMVEIMWSAESGDSAGAPPSVVLANTVAGLRPGAIILMHENRGSTLSMLPQILDAVAAKGLVAVTVPYMLAYDPPTEAQLRAGGGCGVSPTIPPSQWPAS